MHVKDLYESVTATVIEQLEAGAPPWARPWADGKIRGLGMIPSNLVSGRLYSGGNILLLWLKAIERGYSTLQFCTFKQLNDIGARVRKGEKATHIIFTKHVIKEDENGQEKPSTIAKSYPVFNVGQLENVPEEYLTTQSIPEDDVSEYTQATALVKNNGVKVTFGGNNASYNRATDEISMPFKKQFISEDVFWQVMNHELTHWSGNERRLARSYGKRFGDDAYAFEELVAELGSAFLCARLGIPTGFRSASYIAVWLKVMRADNRAIFSAASYAGHAADYLWNNAFPEEKVAAAE